MTHDLLGQDINTIVVGIISFLTISFLPTIFDFVLSRRPRLVYWQTKPASVTFNGQLVQPEVLYIKNVGGQEARNVRVIHNWPRDTFKAVVRSIEYTESQTPDEQVIFNLPSIHRGETCIITYIHSTPPSQDPLLCAIRVDDHEARLVDPPTVPRYPKLVIWFSRSLTFIGAWLVLYVVIRLLILGLIFVWHILF